MTSVDFAIHLELFGGGLAVAILASDLAVRVHAGARGGARRLAVPRRGRARRLGTGLPEIANSVVSHLEGEGDVDVGDSVGSTLTQYTLVLGLFPVVTGDPDRPAAGRSPSGS